MVVDIYITMKQQLCQTIPSGDLVSAMLKSTTHNTNLAQLAWQRNLVQPPSFLLYILHQLNSDILISAIFKEMGTFQNKLDIMKF